MAVRKKIPYGSGIFSVTFTCARWLPLFEITNGYDFVHFVDMLKKVKVKEMQFTLDGTKAIHDARRGTANKKGTFDQVVAGIEQPAAEAGPVRRHHWNADGVAR